MNIFNPQGDPQIEARLYFGRNINGDPAIGKSDFRSFCNDSVTPHFLGFTYFDGVGSWEGALEQCFILSILMEDNANNRRQCETIAEQYCDRFNQEAVAVQFLPCQYAFVSSPAARAHKRSQEFRANGSQG